MVLIVELGVPERSHGCLGGVFQLAAQGEACHLGGGHRGGHGDAGVYQAAGELVEEGRRLAAGKLEARCCEDVCPAQLLEDGGDRRVEQTLAGDAGGDVCGVARQHSSIDGDRGVCEDVLPGGAGHGEGLG